MPSPALLSLVLAVPALHAQPVAPDMSARVEEHRVERPGLRVSVPRGATYLGADRFVLKQLTDCEMHVFVEADAARRVRRFYWVHFETYLPSRPESRFTYGDTDRRTRLWGEAAWISARPAQSSKVPRAGWDTEHFRAMIRRAGYIMPAEFLTVRLVRLLDDPKGTGYGRHELMLIYGEDIAPGMPGYADLTTNNTVNDRWARVEPALVRRAARAFAVRKGR